MNRATAPSLNRNPQLTQKNAMPNYVEGKTKYQTTPDSGKWVKNKEIELFHLFPGCHEMKLKVGAKTCLLSNKRQSYALVPMLLFP